MLKCIILPWCRSLSNTWCNAKIFPCILLSIGNLQKSFTLAPFKTLFLIFPSSVLFILSLRTPFGVNFSTVLLNTVGPHYENSLCCFCTSCSKEASGVHPSEAVFVPLMASFHSWIHLSRVEVKGDRWPSGKGSDTPTAQTCMTTTTIMWRLALWYWS
jgi:hypothetical protein